ncbi:hypothetical protein ACFVAV_04265 [Nocardia sp. NPDC057663]|uniref:hypothetical protein n=1 Tax=Nocardia sp. NPDC057663 TaxID=3346201 RepID=UPI00366C535A
MSTETGIALDYPVQGRFLFVLAQGVVEVVEEKVADVFEAQSRCGRRRPKG